MIRLAALSDLDAIAELIRGSFDPALGPYMVYAQHGTSAFLAAYVAHPDLAGDRTMLVATEGARVTAFAEFRRGEEARAHLSYICVAPAARGRGLAEALIRHFVALAGQSVLLDLYVFADNAAALSLYRRLGFSPEGETRWFVRDLPVAQGGEPIGVANWPVASAAFERFGFCELQLAWRGQSTRLGRIGPGVLRCHNGADFADDALLGRLAAAFPGIREALIIDLGPIATARLVNRSIRLVGTL